MLNAFFVNFVINAAVHFETNIRYLLNYNKTIKHEISISYNTKYYDSTNLFTILL